MALNEIVATVSIVIQLISGSVVGSASGFFYTKDEKLFLVTNQHVMRNDKKRIVPDTLRLRLHTDQNDIRKNGELDVPLYNNGKKLWKIHSNYPDADVALDEIHQERLIASPNIEVGRSHPQVLTSIRTADPDFQGTRLGVNQILKDVDLAFLAGGVDRQNPARDLRLVRFVFLCLEAQLDTAQATIRRGGLPRFV